jgi:hypothetical protein
MNFLRVPASSPSSGLAAAATDFGSFDTSSSSSALGKKPIYEILIRVAAVDRLLKPSRHFRHNC